MTSYLQNLQGGLQLAFFLKPDDTRFHVSWHSLATIVLSVLAAHFLIDTIISAQDSSLNINSWHRYHVGLFSIVILMSYTIRSLFFKTDHVLKIAVMFYNAYFIIWLPYFTLYALYPSWMNETLERNVDVAVMIWGAIVTFRIVSSLSDTNMKHALISGIACMTALYALNTHIGMSYFYYAPQDNENTKKFAEYEALSSEEVFTMQNDLMQKSFEGMSGSKRRITDIYSITFAPYRYQDVFMREAKFVTDSFIHILGIENRNVTLINNEETIFDLPLASTTNLGNSLKTIASLMQTKEDVLFLYITSHGDEENGISVALDYRHTMVNLSGERLAEMLKTSGIKNKVIFISACHSGALIPDLQDDNTMIITSAADNKQSYGCSNNTPLTYFAEAYFKQALTETTDLERAFHLTKDIVEKREKKENLSPPSDPQIFIGKNIKSVLKKYRGATLISDDNK